MKKAREEKERIKKMTERGIVLTENTITRSQRSSVI